MQYFWVGWVFDPSDTTYVLGCGHMGYKPKNSLRSLCKTYQRSDMNVGFSRRIFPDYGEISLRTPERVSYESFAVGIAGMKVTNLHECVWFLQALCFGENKPLIIPMNGLQRCNP